MFTWRIPATDTAPAATLQDGHAGKCHNKDNLAILQGKAGKVSKLALCCMQANGVPAAAHSEAAR